MYISQIKVGFLAIIGYWEKIDRLLSSDNVNMLKYSLKTLTFLWYASISAIIVLGWTQREQRYLVAESGIGYWFGILGGILMLILLLYPLRKRISHWKYVGSVKAWFRLHMFFGIMGPVLIIFHSGFRLGSLNGQVAFFSMLLVAISGLIGRYFYQRIHHGLYGEKIGFMELYQADENWEAKLSKGSELEPEILEELHTIEHSLANQHTGMNRSFWFYLKTQSRVNHLRKLIRKKMKPSKNRKQLFIRISSLRKITKLGQNEILFSYWHVFHFPFFIILIFASIFHVIVVHFY